MSRHSSRRRSAADLQPDALSGPAPASVSGASQAATAPIDRITGGYSRYQIGSEIGRGGIGLVNLASDPALRREVAIKRLLVSDHDRVMRFLEEAQVTGQLEHPNIVPIYELGSDVTGRPFLAMKRIQGHTLYDMIRGAAERGDQWQDNAGQFLEVFGKVCDAIAYAHNRRVIHRDLKPQNVMVGEFGEVLVLDWGLARPLDADPATDHALRPLVTTDRRSELDVDEAQLTQYGEVFGTPAFMPPEQAHGWHDKIDERSDIFALGAILYSLLTLRPPYDGDSSLQVVVKAATGKPPPVRRAAPERRIPKELEAICSKAMAKERARRYQTASELKADIQAHLASLPIRARRDPLLTRFVKWAKRHPTTTMTGTVSVVFGLVITVLLMQLRATQQAAALEAERAELEHAQRELAEATAAEQSRRAEREQAQRELAEERFDDLGERMSDLLDAQTRESLREFNTLWNRARRAGLHDDDFAATLSPEQIEEFLRAQNAQFEVMKALGSEPEAGQYHRRAVMRGVSGDHRGAREDLTDAIRRQPEEPMLWVNRAISWAETADWQNAMDDFEEALRIEPGFLPALMRRAQVLTALRRFEDAITDLDEVLESQPRSTSALTMRGHAYRELGQAGPAMKDFQKAIRLNTTSWQGWYGRGMVLAERGNYDAAIADFDQAMRLNARDPGVWYQRGLARYKSGDLDGALSDYTEALRINPGFGEASYQLGNIARKRGDLQAAIDHFTRAIEARPDFAEAWINRGSARSDVGAFGPALQDLNRGIELEPARWNAFVLRGIVHFRMDNIAAAIADYQHAWRECPDSRKAAIAEEIRRLGGQVPD